MKTHGPTGHTKDPEAQRGRSGYGYGASTCLRFVLFVILVGIVVAVGAAVEPSPVGARQGESARSGAPQRIISVIPAVTEMLFAVGAGPQVVAVGSFDKFPPEVEKLPRVGALVDPDVERMLSLRPDLVIVYGSQTDLRTQLDRAKVPMYVYRHAELSDVTVTIRDLGARVGRRGEAERLASGIEARLAALRRRVAGRPRPRVLAVIGRESGALRGIYASGGVGFIDDMIVAAGGTNVFADVKQQAVQATSELVLSRRPDVIIELKASPLSPEQIRREIAVWNTVSSIPAVRNGRVFLLNDERTVVPGPRVAEGTELIARALHPDAGWGRDGVRPLKGPDPIPHNLHSDNNLGGR